MITNTNSFGSTRGPVFLTQDAGTLALLEQAAKIAAADVTVLIQGESGTGKELFAKHIHQSSKRKAHRQVSINCGAIPENLLLSELFGHEKGAFTGAVSQKIGLAEVASGGSLFLDEIGEMGLEAQAKLLRFLQEGEIRRVGAKEPISVDVRVISATNRDLKSLVQEGKLREDLYYRVNAVSLKIPALRERPNDIPLLIEHFFLNSGVQRRLEFTEEAMEVLIGYRWPGNVRELQNLVERLKILVSEDTVTVNDLPENIRRGEESPSPSLAPDSFLLADLERNHILKVLDHFQGNKTRAATAMGITVKTLYNKLARYNQ